jgi:uncharacterized membrane protein YsdA (DUF1294 family)
MLILYVTAMSGVSFAAFAWDKYCAVRGRWRVPERTLLMLALIGGTPGAFSAQRLLRHKTQKQPFGTYLVAIAALQVIALLAIGFFGGAPVIALLALL